MTFVPRGGLKVEARRGGPPLVAPHDSPLGHISLRAPLDEAALDELCDRVRRLAGSDARPVICDVVGLKGLETVAMLARLQLTARRLGGSIRVQSASAELHDVLRLVGLCDVLGPCAPLLLEAGGQAEEREEPRGVEEEGDPPDPVA